MRHRRMQIDRYIERLRALEDGPIFLVVEERTLLMSVDHCALESKLLHAAFQLAGGLFGIGRRQRCKAGEASGMCIDRFVETLVGVTGHRNRDLFARACGACAPEAPPWAL